MFFRRKKAAFKRQGCLKTAFCAPFLLIVDGEEGAEAVFVKEISDEERSEFAVTGAHFLEAHLVNKFFELEDVVGKEGDAPFIVIKADRARHDLPDGVRVFAAGHS